MKTNFAGELVWTEDMGEISGFGFGYEVACRKMLLAAVRWFDEHPGSFDGIDAPPRGTRQGSPVAQRKAIEVREHPDYAAFETAILAAEPSPSGAMFGDVCSHAFFIRKNGVAEWTKQLRAREAKKSPAEKAKDARDAKAVHDSLMKGRH